MKLLLQLIILLVALALAAASAGLLWLALKVYALVGWLDAPDAPRKMP